MARALICWTLLLMPGCLRAQVVVSRRVYAVHGRTFQQLWFSPGRDAGFKQLTRSRRDHSQPVCSRDGKLLYFVSDQDAALSLNQPYEGPGEREIWRYDRQTTIEQMVWKTSDPDGAILKGTAADGALLVMIGGGLSQVGRNPWRIEKVDFTAISPDGLRLAIVIPGSRDAEGQSHDPRLFITDSASGQSRLPLGPYEFAVWSPGGAFLAVVGGSDIGVIDARTGREIERVRFSLRDSPLEDLVWSPDEKRLLVGIYGENGGAGDPQHDYFLLDLAARTWTQELTAQDVLWLPGGDTVLHRKPIELLPLATGNKHSVWTTQLALYDLATHRETPLTMGLQNNLAMRFCGK